MKTIITKALLVTFSIFGSMMSYAAQRTPQENREELIINMFSLTQTMAFVVGLYLMISFFSTVKRRADAPGDQSASTSKILLILFTATFLLNLNVVINTMTTTITGTDAYCFGLAPALSTDTSTAMGPMNSSGLTSNANCFKPESSEITEAIRAKLDPSTTSTADLLSYLSLVMGLVQFLGLVFFIKAILMIRQIGQGQGQVGPGKVIIALIFSALIIDLPHTMEMLSYTIKSLGVTL